MYTVPLQTGLMILGELSKGLMFSLFAVGDVCLASWTRHSFAMQKRKIVRFLNSAADSGRTCIKTTYLCTQKSVYDVYCLALLMSSVNPGESVR